MFVARCPKCKLRDCVVTADATEFDDGLRRAFIGVGTKPGADPAQQAAKAMIGLVAVGREMWKRCPGGGPKLCTRCDLQFR